MLGGCAEAQTIRTEGFAAGMNYYSRMIHYRSEVDRKCFEIVELEADDLVRQGKFAEARQTMSDAYAQLVLPTAITESPKEALAVLNSPQTCGAED